MYRVRPPRVPRQSYQPSLLSQMFIPLLQSLDIFPGEWPIILYGAMKPTEKSQLDCQFVYDLYRLYKLICYISYLDMYRQLWQFIKWRWPHGTDLTTCHFYARPVKAYIYQVFPATTTVGTYEVQNPPSGYPPLEVSNLAVITDTTFSTVTSVDVE